MLERCPRLSKFATRLLEIAGAGCASACAALLLGNLRDPPYPPAPPIVRLAPADEQVIHYVGVDAMALVEELRGARRHFSNTGRGSVGANALGNNY